MRQLKRFNRVPRNAMPLCLLCGVWIAAHAQPTPVSCAIEAEDFRDTSSVTFGPIPSGPALGGGCIKAHCSPTHKQCADSGGTAAD